MNILKATLGNTENYLLHIVCMKCIAKRIGNENRYFTIHNGTVEGSASLRSSCHIVWISCSWSARHDSDWDVLILLDKPKIESADYDNVSYPLVELGWSLNECISPVLYTFKDWVKQHFTPFYHNVKDEGIQLV